MRNQRPGRAYSQYGSQPVVGDPVVEAMREGWEHVRQDIRLPQPAYDKWDEARQLNYEAGRRAAAVLKPYLGQLPRWAKGVAFTSLIPVNISERAFADFETENALTAFRRAAL